MSGLPLEVEATYNTIASSVEYDFAGREYKVRMVADAFRSPDCPSWLSPEAAEILAIQLMGLAAEAREKNMKEEA